MLAEACALFPLLDALTTAVSVDAAIVSHAVF